jgi:glycine hydroxymethyltransferase
MVTSGIRVGTPALTTRGMGTAEMEEIGALIARVLKAPADEGVQSDVRRQVLVLARRFPLYRERSKG